MPISFGRNVLGETIWAKRFGRKFWPDVLEPYFESGGWAAGFWAKLAGGGLGAGAADATGQGWAGL